MGTTDQMEPLEVLWMAHTLPRNLPKIDAPNKGVMDKHSVLSFRGGGL